MLDTVVDTVLSGDAEFKHYFSSVAARAAGQVDYLFAAGDEPHEPDDIFTRLRWGGQFVYVSRNAKQTAETSSRFSERGFALVRSPFRWWFVLTHRFAYQSEIPHHLNYFPS